jgi:hypothetical protein
MSSASSDVDTLGYLLAAMVFSVTLLINRTQESANSAMRDASDASWRLSELISKPDGAAVADITSALIIARENRDWTREVTRWVNAGLFLSICVAFLDAERISWWDPPHAQDTALLAALLMGSAVLVFVLGEFHHSYWARRSRNRIRMTLVGQLLVLDTLIRERDISGAEMALDLIARSYPRWNFLAVMRCRLAYLQDDDLGSIRMGEDVFDEVGMSYSAALVMAAAAVRLGTPQKALSIFESADGEKRTREFIELSRTVGLLAGNFDCLIEPDPGVPHEASDVVQPLNTSSQRWNDRLENEPSSLDFSFDDFEPLVSAASVYYAWHNEEMVPDDLFAKPEPLSLVIKSLSPSGVDLEAFDKLAQWSVESNSTYGSEIAGIVGLALGRPNVSYNLLLRASSTRPASSRLHLLMAISASRMGWHDRARVALANSAQLGGLDSAVYDLARVTIDPKITRRSIEPTEFGTKRNNESVVLAALMGLDLSMRYGIPPPSTSAGYFLKSLCEHSLHPQAVSV